MNLKMSLARAFLVLVAIVATLVPFSSSQSVIVIGGGVSGLKAAADLDRAGFNVTLFEAMGRIGGRTYTLKLRKLFSMTFMT